MKKALDQTLRDLKRGVNKKVLKVPSVEQKVLDATSNEPWGPHGSLLADIANSTRNYHEYQMIMVVIWKRINDTGKNWRHVYKALTVLEYLVAHGSERVIDDIKEHAYQISTLSDFQYIDSSGRDQGLNVRKKSQSLVNLVNDKERIEEVRQKASSNRDKFRTSSASGMHRPHSYSGGYGDRFEDERYEGRYGPRDDDRNGNGRDREWSYKDGDPYSRDGDQASRDSEERYGRGTYRDDDYQGRNTDDNGSRSSDREKGRAYDDDDQHSSRGSSGKTDDLPQEGRRPEQKFSEQSPGAPPSYEEAVVGSKSPDNSEREGETTGASVSKTASPIATTDSVQPSADPGSFSQPNKEAELFDEFDPRTSMPAAPGPSDSTEMDLLGSLSDLSLAITTVPSEPPSFDVPSSGTAYSEPSFGATDSASTSFEQSFEDPFGETPFRATPFGNTPETQSSSATSSFHAVAQAPPMPQQVDGGSSNFGNTFNGLTFSAPNEPTFQVPTSNLQLAIQEAPLPNQNDDILAGILPLSEPSSAPAPQEHTSYGPSSQLVPPSYSNAPNFLPQSGSPFGSVPPLASQNLAIPTAQYSNNVNPQLSSPSINSHMAPPQMPSTTLPQQSNNDLMGDFLTQTGQTRNLSSQSSAPAVLAGALALVPQAAPKEKFEPKSKVWADTLSKGLVNLNISGPKCNPNSDIGIDFESLNRKEKRMEKPSASPVISTVSMGKAMGSGSGMSRGSGMGVRPSSNPMMGTGMGMGGMPGGGAPHGGMGMGGMLGGVPHGGMGMGGMPGGAPHGGMGMGGMPGGAPHGGMPGGAPHSGMGMGGMPGGPGMGMVAGNQGMGAYGSMNQPGGGNMGMQMGMGGNMGLQMGLGGNMGMQMGMGGNVGMQMGRGVPMQQHSGAPLQQPTMPSGYNPMMGRGGYASQQHYGGGYQ